jgi:hypothetical protein
MTSTIPLSEFGRLNFEIRLALKALFSNIKSARILIYAK